MTLRSLQVWLSHQPEPVDLELVCAEHPGRDVPVDTGAAGRPDAAAGAGTLVRLPGCAATVAPYELVELLDLGARRVRVCLDGCADPARALEHLGPVVAVVAAGMPGRLVLTGARTSDDPVDTSAGDWDDLDDTSNQDEHAVTPRGTATVVPGRAGADPADRPGTRGRPARPSRRRRSRRVLDAAHMPVSRRGLLGLGPGAGRGLPPDTVVPGRLAAAVAAVVPAGTDGLEGYPAPASRLSARGCTACGVCVQACPAGALAWRESGTEPVLGTLEQLTAACDGCLRCVTLCPAGALTEAGHRSWADVLSGVPVPVVTLATARCRRCGSRFPTTSGGAWCPVCDFRRRHPFGSVPAPGRPAAAGAPGRPAATGGPARPPAGDPSDQVGPPEDLRPLPAPDRGASLL